MLDQTRREGRNSCFSKEFQYSDNVKRYIINKVATMLWRTTDMLSSRMITYTHGRNYMVKQSRDFDKAIVQSLEQ